MNLECSSKGDKRFSAMYAKVNGITIENRYQLSKRFLHNGLIVYPSSIKECKHWQYKNDYILLDFIAFNNIFSIQYLSMYYKFLWYLYFIEHKDLIDYIKKFDTFTDCFRKENTKNCQADIIQLIAKEGLDELYKQCKFFIHKFLF